MSISLSDDEIRQVAALISSERLTTFVRITGTERDAIELHHQTMQVAAALMPVIGLIEIALRNAVCERLRSTFDAPDWLTNPVAPFQWKGEEEETIRRCGGWARRAAYVKKSQAEKKALDLLAFGNGVPESITHEHRSKSRQKVIPVTTGQLIAQLTLFFWKRLFSADYEQTLWKRSLRRLFPRKFISRSQVADHLETLYQARNRMAHHEPIYGERLKRVLDAVDFILLNMMAKHPDEDTVLAKITAPCRLTLVREAATLEDMLARYTVAVSSFDQADES